MRTLSFLIFLLSFPILCAAESPSEMEHEVSQEFRSARFSTTRTVAELPPTIQSALSLRSYPMANAGAEWNAGCIIDTRPGRRLVVGAVSPQIVAVFYEQGGYAVHRVLELFRIGHRSKALRRCQYDATDSADSTVSDLDTLRAAFPSKFQLIACETLNTDAPALDGSAEF